MSNLNPTKTDIGGWGEARAAHYLFELGWTIVTRNFHIRGGELDIIAYDGETLVFVEVRTRRDQTPEASINSKKVTAIRRAASSYIQKMGLFEPEIRFDLIAIEGQVLRHHKNSLSRELSGSTQLDDNLDIATDDPYEHG